MCPFETLTALRVPCTSLYEYLPLSSPRNRRGTLLVVLSGSSNDKRTVYVLESFYDIKGNTRKVFTVF